MLIWLLVRSVADLNDPAASASGTSWLGMGPPPVIGIAIVAVGVVLMIGWRLRDGTFWRERPSAAPEEPGRS
ncbi:hypothetical protein [Pseudonocardia xishanensis]|uniref:Secreted protein with PEP-CTERM sorting signal n=1 Tax=Pseudonocardia xishanensis TaxID=630995 RepID=A0ABP8RT93_9PSEU